MKNDFPVSDQIKAADQLTTNDCLAKRLFNVLRIIERFGNGDKVTVHVISEYLGAKEHEITCIIEKSLSKHLSRQFVAYLFLPVNDRRRLKPTQLYSRVPEEILQFSKHRIRELLAQFEDINIVQLLRPDEILRKSMLG